MSSDILRQMAYTDFDWITDRFAVGAFVSEQYDEFPFDAVLSMETHAPPSLRDLALAENVKYRWVSIIDGYSWEEHEEIIRRFDTAAAQIDAWMRKGKRVLVHCAAGISRSATALAWYLVRCQEYSWMEAVELIRRFRPQINPNPRFEIPLRMAAGEKLTEDDVRARLAEYCIVQAERMIDVDPAEIWTDLERQGTLQHLLAVRP